MRALAVRFESQLIRFALPGEEVRIGSSHANDIALPFPGVSRVHATLAPTPGGAMLTDLGSKNLTKKQVIALMMEDANLIRRPIVVKGSKEAIFGYDEAVYDSLR